MTFFPARTTLRASWRQTFVFPLPASPWRRVMHPSSTPPPRRSSRARQPRATFIGRTRRTSPLILRGVRTQAGEIGTVLGPHDPRAPRRPLPVEVHAPLRTGFRMHGDGLTCLVDADLRLEPLHVHAPQVSEVLRLV